MTSELLILLEEGAFHTIRFTCFLNGRRLSPDSPNMPSHLRSLSRLLYSRVSIDEKLSAAFDDMDDFSIIFKPPHITNQPIFKWKKDFICRSQVVISEENSDVVLTPSFVYQDTILTSASLFGELFVIDKELMTLGRLSDRHGWHFFEVMSQKLASYSKAGRLKCPRAMFLNACEWHTNGDVLPTVFGASDFKVLDVFTFSPSINIVQDFDGYSLQLSYGGTEVSVIAPAWKFFATLTNVPWYCLGQNAGQWVWVSSHFETERIIYETLKEIIGDRFLTSELDEGVFIAASNLSLVVAALKEKLAAFDIPIRVMDASLEMDQLEASVEIVSTSPDEYEVVSTFKIGDRVYTGFDWLGVMSSGGVVQIDGNTHVLDPKSLALIQHVLSVKEAHASSKKSGDVVRFSRLEILDWLMLKHHGVAVQLPASEQEIFNRLASLDELPKQELPELFSGVLRDYQYYGYCWLRFLYDCRFGACLADDMGLGKTIQALVFLSSISVKQEFGPHLIVVPPSLVFNWSNEIQRFCPKLTTVVYNAKEVHTTDGIDILITTYDVLRRHSDWFDQRQFHVLVFDEAQYIKNLTAGRTKAARQIKRQFTLALTGTPVENHFGEYFSIMDVVVPGIFGTYGGFQDLLKNNRADVLLRRTRPFVLRRTKTEILKELPPMVESVDYMPMSAYQSRLYQQILAESRQVVESSFSTLTLAKARVKVLTAILRLRQLCVSPALLDPQFDADSPKINRLKELIQELYWEGHHVLIFTQFRRFLDVIEPILTEMKINLVRMDGTTPMKKRGALVEQFQSSPTPMVFLLSLKTGGVGLNLTKANYVIHVDPWWNPAVEDQASSRAHRIGQSQSVFVNRLIIKDSIEERLMQLKAQKSQLFDDVVRFGGHSGGSLTKEDFEFLLSD